MKLHLFVLKRLSAFKPAFSGIIAAIKTEAAVQVHVFAAMVVSLVCIVQQVSILKVVQLFGICFVVISAELFNTAIEKLCDMYSTKHCKEIKYIKDLSAGAVFCIVVAAGFFAYKIMFYP